MANYSTNEFKNGLKVMLEGDPCSMVEVEFVKPGKGTAFTRTKLKNMLNGNVIERTFRTGETVQAADVEEFKAQYLYEDGSFHNFMNLETYEQIAMDSTTLGQEKQYLTENLEIDLLLYLVANYQIGQPI